jgi:glycosyltransferase involved in cell wall biosynthesis
VKPKASTQGSADELPCAGLENEIYDAFDQEWYLAQNPDVAAAGVDACAHYLRFGAAEGRDPSPFFNSSWYLTQNPDVAAAGINPLLHFVRWGAAEGRRPNPLLRAEFNEENFRVRDCVVSPIVIEEEAFSAFWYGNRLSALHWVCLRSFVELGHKVNLYVYEPLEVPKAINLMDASEIISPRNVFLYNNNNMRRGDVGPFSDVFRFKLLLMRGGWWIDVDVLCKDQLIPNCSYAWAAEANFIGTSQIRFPKGDPIVRHLYNDCSALFTKMKFREEIGPALITRVLKQYPTPTSYFGSTQKFYPLKWVEGFKLWLPSFSDEILAKISTASFVPCWGSLASYIGIDHNRRPPRGSVMAELFDQFAEDRCLNEPAYSSEDIIALVARWLRHAGNEWAIDELRRLTTTPSALKELGIEACPYVALKGERNSIMKIVGVDQKEIDREKAEFELAKFFSDDGTKDFELKSGDPVVVCTHSLYPGGAERQWAYLAQSLRTAGYRVTFVTFSLSGEGCHYRALLDGSNIPILDTSMMNSAEIARNLPTTPHLESIIRLAAGAPVERLLQLTAAFNLLKPKALFAQCDDPNTLGGIASQLCGVPRAVLSFRNYNPSRLGWFFQDWYLPCYKLLARSGAVRFTGNSRSANDDYAAWIGVPRERVFLIPNAIDPELFYLPMQSEVARIREELNIAVDQPVLLGVFRLQPEKDPETFVEVVRYLVNVMPNLRVLLAGIGPMRTQLEDRIGALGLARNFQFLGLRGDVNVLMGLADVLLHTSKLEGMPNVVIEAQLMETPVVATRIPGTIDVVLDSTTCSLHPVGDAHGLAQACIELLTNKAKAAEMGAAGRQHVLKSFPKSVLAEQFTNVLR